MIGIDINGCADTTSTSITVNALPTAAITGTNVICDGSSTTLTAAGGTSYAWSNMDVTAATTVMPTSATTYTVTVTDGNGCMDTDQVTVTVNALPTVAIAGTDSICVGDSTTLTASGGNMYAWSSGSMVASTTVNPTANTFYSVMVTDANNFSSTDSIEVIVNGEVIRTEPLTANGEMKSFDFDIKIQKSSWVALRIFPSAHTNPVFVHVGGKPIRANKKSAQWCIDSVAACWDSKKNQIRDTERKAAKESYDAAKKVYQKILAESD